jgi:hypothetical protein
VLLRLDSETVGRLDFHSIRLWIPELPDHIVALLPPADDATAATVAKWTRSAQRSRRT